MSKVLVATHGFFGDIAFATGLAEELSKEFDQVDYLIGFPQMKSLVKNNPFIRTVHVSRPNGPITRPEMLPKVMKYNRTIKLGPLGFEVPPVTEYKARKNFKNSDPSYKLYTNDGLDLKARELFMSLPKGKKVIGVMGNWQERTFLFNKKQYAAGIDVPNKGYGGANRDTHGIVKALSERYTILQLGMPGKSQANTTEIRDDDPKSILFEASVMKYCDAFVGAEGGLANLAAGVGTKTIITGDFVHQLYGPNGVIRKMEDPKLGPKYYFPDAGHVTLDPFLTDKQVIREIYKLV